MSYESIINSFELLNSQTCTAKETEIVLKDLLSIPDQDLRKIDLRDSFDKLLDVTNSHRENLVILNLFILFFEKLITLNYIDKVYSKGKIFSILSIFSSELLVTQPKLSMRYLSILTKLSESQAFAKVFAASSGLNYLFEWLRRISTLAPALLEKQASVVSMIFQLTAFAVKSSTERIIQEIFFDFINSLPRIAKIATIEDKNLHSSFFTLLLTMAELNKGKWINKVASAMISNGSVILLLSNLFCNDPSDAAAALLTLLAESCHDLVHVLSQVLPPIFFSLLTFGSRYDEMIPSDIKIATSYIIDSDSYKMITPDFKQSRLMNWTIFWTFLNMNFETFIGEWHQKSKMDYSAFYFSIFMFSARKTAQRSFVFVPEFLPKLSKKYLSLNSILAELKTGNLDEKMIPFLVSFLLLSTKKNSILLNDNFNTSLQIWDILAERQQPFITRNVISLVPVFLLVVSSLPDIYKVAIFSIFTKVLGKNEDDIDVREVQLLFISSLINSKIFKILNTMLLNLSETNPLKRSINDEVEEVGYELVPLICDLYKAMLLHLSVVPSSLLSYCDGLLAYTMVDSMVSTQATQIMSYIIMRQIDDILDAHLLDHFLRITISSPIAMTRALSFESLRYFSKTILLERLPEAVVIHIMNRGTTIDLSQDYNQFNIVWNETSRTAVLDGERAEAPTCYAGVYLTQYLQNQPIILKNPDSFLRALIRNYDNGPKDDILKSVSYLIEQQIDDLSDSIGDYAEFCCEKTVSDPDYSSEFNFSLRRILSFPCKKFRPKIIASLSKKIDYFANFVFDPKNSESFVRNSSLFVEILKSCDQNLLKDSSIRILQLLYPFSKPKVCQNIESLENMLKIHTILSQKVNFDPKIVLDSPSIIFFSIAMFSEGKFFPFSPSENTLYLYFELLNTFSRNKIICEVMEDILSDKIMSMAKSLNTSFTFNAHEQEIFEGAAAEWIYSLENAPEGQELSEIVTFFSASYENPSPISCRKIESKSRVEAIRPARYLDQLIGNLSRNCRDDELHPIVNQINQYYEPVDSEENQTALQLVVSRFNKYASPEELIILMEKLAGGSPGQQLNIDSEILLLFINKTLLNSASINFTTSFALFKLIDRFLAFIDPVDLTQTHLLIVLNALAFITLPRFAKEELITPVFNSLQHLSLFAESEYIYSKLFTSYFKKLFTSQEQISKEAVTIFLKGTHSLHNCWTSTFSLSLHSSLTAFARSNSRNLTQIPEPLYKISNPSLIIDDEEVFLSQVSTRNVSSLNNFKMYHSLIELMLKFTYEWMQESSQDIVFESLVDASTIVTTTFELISAENINSLSNDSTSLCESLLDTISCDLTSENPLFVMNLLRFVQKIIEPVSMATQLVESLDRSFFLGLIERAIVHNFEKSVIDFYRKLIKTIPFTAEIMFDSGLILVAYSRVLKSPVDEDRLAYCAFISSCCSSWETCNNFMTQLVGIPLMSELFASPNQFLMKIQASQKLPISSKKVNSFLKNKKMKYGGWYSKFCLYAGIQEDEKTTSFNTGRNTSFRPELQANN